jgi:hypothetical protein
MTDTGEHSPLSPHTPSSPVYPDGIMHLAWIRKYREQMPAVVISLYELYDRTAELNSRLPSPTPIGGRVQSMGPGSFGAVSDIASALQSDKEKDDEMIHEILEERQHYTELGIRYIAIVLLSKAQKTDPAAEERVNAIRRGCGMDARSLLVLPPCSPEELKTFVSQVFKSLQDAGPMFYRELARRVKRRMVRPPAQGGYRTGQTSSTSVSTAVQRTGEGASGCILPPEGWNARYEFKLGVFAELGQDFGRAIR